MRVLFVSHGYGYGNNLMYFEPIFYNLAKAIPDLIIPMDKNYPVDMYPNLPLKPMLSFFVKKISREIGNIKYVTETKIPSASCFINFLRTNPDVFIFIEFTPIAILAFMASRMLKKPSILLIESDPTLRGGGQSAFMNRVKKYIASRVTLVLTNNEAGQNFLINKLSVSSDKIRMKPYLTSSPSFYDQKMDNMMYAKKIHIENKVNFLFLNTISERKGVFQLAKSLKLIDKSILSNMHIHIVGGGDDYDKIDTELKKIDALSYTMYGAANYQDIGRYYLAADIVLCPTLADYRSLSGFEALSYGKAILISKYDGAHSEVLKNCENGFIFDPMDIKDFSEKIVSLVTDKSKIIDFSEKSLMLSETYSLSTVCNNILSVTQEALSIGYKP